MFLHPLRFTVTWLDRELALDSLAGKWYQLTLHLAIMTILLHHFSILDELGNVIKIMNSTLQNDLQELNIGADMGLINALTMAQ